jgi:hypothetical protein
LLLHNFIDAVRNLPNLDGDPTADYRCYVISRPYALRASKVFEEVLLPYTQGLEEFEIHHRCGDADIEANQISDISPHKHGSFRKNMSVSMEDFPHE